MDKDEVYWFTNNLPLDIDTLEKQMGDELAILSESKRRLKQRRIPLVKS